jgi:hypothetical protein
VWKLAGPRRSDKVVEVIEVIEVIEGTASTFP